MGRGANTNMDGFGVESVQYCTLVMSVQEASTSVGKLKWENATDVELRAGIK